MGGAAFRLSRSTRVLVLWRKRVGTQPRHSCWTARPYVPLSLHPSIPLRIVAQKRSPDSISVLSSFINHSLPQYRQISWYRQTFTYCFLQLESLMMIGPAIAYALCASNLTELLLIIWLFFEVGHQLVTENDDFSEPSRPFDRSEMRCEDSLKSTWVILHRSPRKPRFVVPYPLYQCLELTMRMTTLDA